MAFYGVYKDSRLRTTEVQDAKPLNYNGRECILTLAYVKVIFKLKEGCCICTTQPTR